MPQLSTTRTLGYEDEEDDRDQHEEDYSHRYFGGHSTFSSSGNNEGVDEGYEGGETSSNGGFTPVVSKGTRRRRQS